MARKTYGIDFGTGTIKVYKKGQGLVLNERNAVSIVGKERKTVAIGEKAYEMFEKVPPSIKVSFPISHGVISDIDAMISMCDFMISKLSGKRRPKGQELLIAVPSDTTDVQKQAYAIAVTEGICKPKLVYLIDKPIATAYGMGLDVEKANGILIVDIGADTTEISILSLGGVVLSTILQFGGNYFDEQIVDYVRKKQNFIIGKRTAENVKKSLISAFPIEKEVIAAGRDVIRGLPGEVMISAKDINPLMSDVFHEISSCVRLMLERTPPEISQDIMKNGIYLTGGSSFINGVNQLIANETYLRVNSAKNAQSTTINGMGYLTEHPKLALKYAIPL